MEEFVRGQSALEIKIGNSFSNFKKQGQAKMAKGATQIRMQSLEKYWEKFEIAHNKFSLSDEVDKTHAYFTDDKIEKVRELYLERMGEFQDHLNTFDIPSSSSLPLNISEAGQLTNRVVNQNCNIPTLPLPSFDGDYLQWSSFKSLFDATISLAPNLTEVSKITYLRGCLKDEPLELIKEIPVAEGNFNEIWRNLESQYENQRRVVNILVQKLFSLNPMTSESASEIKRIVNGITSPLATLKILGRKTSDWDDLLISLTVSKLESNIKKEWEESLGDSTDPPVFDTLVKFLKNKLVALEAFEI